jgi:Ribbon-helix-helix protein, copG family
MADKRRIDIKVTEKEFEILDRYCNDMGLSKTVVLRELIRKLGEEIAAKAAQSLQGG